MRECLVLVLGACFLPPATLPGAPVDVSASEEQAEVPDYLARVMEYDPGAVYGSLVGNEEFVTACVSLLHEELNKNGCIESREAMEGLLHCMDAPTGLMNSELTPYLFKVSDENNSKAFRERLIRWVTRARRLNAVWAIAKYGSQDEVRELKFFMKQLEHEKGETNTISKALAVMGDEAHQKRWLELLHSENLDLRMSAVQFAQVCPNPKAIPALLSMLIDPSFDDELYEYSTPRAKVHFALNHILKSIGYSHLVVPNPQTPKSFFYSPFPDELADTWRHWGNIHPSLAKGGISSGTNENSRRHCNLWDMAPSSYLVPVD